MSEMNDRKCPNCYKTLQPESVMERHLFFCTSPAVEEFRRVSSEALKSKCQNP